MSVRTLQRRFSSDVGVTPERVICRYRLHEAIGPHRSGPGFSVLFVESAAPRGPCHIRRCGMYVSCIQPVFLYSDVLVQPFERSV
ncbi:hypothetical protein CFB39_19710 [Burkholderia sp. AU6039]|nr:hypothetical protein CFB39_19710 [Burkholderia sp. AU6039]